jgi:hypothetical protein
MLSKFKKGPRKFKKTYKRFYLYIVYL